MNEVDSATLKVPARVQGASGAPAHRPLMPRHEWRRSARPKVRAMARATIPRAPEARPRVRAKARAPAARPKARAPEAPRHASDPG
jgi:hypothetical protein